MLAFWSSASGGFDSAEVQTLPSQPQIALAGWLHYLAFDLFVGAWEARTARAEGIPHWAVIPCLILTFLFGPAGLWPLRPCVSPLSERYCHDSHSCRPALCRVLFPRTDSFGPYPFVALAALPLMAAYGLDDRVFQGDNVWLKPLKFHLALTVYTGTLTLFATLLPEGTFTSRRWRTYFGVVTLAVLAELVWIKHRRCPGNRSTNPDRPLGVRSTA